MQNAPDPVPRVRCIFSARCRSLRALCALCPAGRLSGNCPPGLQQNLPVVFPASGGEHNHTGFRDSLPLQVYLKTPALPDCCIPRGAGDTAVRLSKQSSAACPAKSSDGRGLLRAEQLLIQRFCHTQGLFNIQIGDPVVPQGHNALRAALEQALHGIGAHFCGHDAVLRGG